MCKFWYNLFRKNKNSVTTEDNLMKKFLIVGLGNIGAEYANTRHNIGFKILDFLADKKEVNFETRKLGDVDSFKLKGRKFILLKPSTYMNLSGKSVVYWLAKEKIPLENLLIVTDDLNLPLGSIRLKVGGSDGGHNGLKNIEELLQTNVYPRLRVGVGDEFSEGKQIDFVLGKFDNKEEDLVQEVCIKSVEAVLSFCSIGIDRTMNQFN